MDPSINRSIPYCFTDTEVTPQDITCLHAALSAADPEMLLCVLLQTCLSWKLDPLLLTGSVKRHLLKKTTSVLGLMHDIEPAPLDDPDRLLIPVQTFSSDGAGGVMERSVSAAILDVSDVDGSEEGVLDYALSIQACASPSSEAHGQGKGFPSASSAERLASADVLIGLPWSHVLGHALWLPSSLTEYERASVLAHLFWVMSFSGFAEAVSEMRSLQMRPCAPSEEAPSKTALCFQEERIKMERIAGLMNHNSLVDVHRVVSSLKRALVA